VVLDLEHVVEAELVGELDLVEGLVNDAALVVGVPLVVVERLREPELVEEAELHGGASGGRWRDYTTTGRVRRGSAGRDWTPSPRGVKA
jgi:hypothetical protein